MTFNRTTLLACAATLAFAGCETESGARTTGGVLGAIAGGLVGSQFGSGAGRALATTLGVVAGAYFGAEIAEALTEEDERYMADAAVSALNDEEEEAVRAWWNEASGNSGIVEAGAIESDGDQTCREFAQSVTLADGTSETVSNKACQNADGSWTVNT